MVLKTEMKLKGNVTYDESGKYL